MGKNISGLFPYFIFVPCRRAEGPSCPFSFLPSTFAPFCLYSLRALCPITLAPSHSCTLLSFALAPSCPCTPHPCTSPTLAPCTLLHLHPPTYTLPLLCPLDLVPSNPCTLSPSSPRALLPYEAPGETFTA